MSFDNWIYIPPFFWGAQGNLHSPSTFMLTITLRQRNYRIVNRAKKHFKCIDNDNHFALFFLLQCLSLVHVLTLNEHNTRKKPPIAYPATGGTALHYDEIGLKCQKNKSSGGRGASEQPKNRGATVAPLSPCLKVLYRLPQWCNHCWRRGLPSGLAQSREVCFSVPHLAVGQQTTWQRRSHKWYCSIIVP